MTTEQYTMTSVHSIFSWLKRKEKSSKKHKSDSSSGSGVAVTAGVISGSAKCRRSSNNQENTHGNTRGSVCRQSLMLPPIPRDQLFSHLPDRLWTDSPSHVYEEIPLSTFELETSLDNATDVKLNHLDLSKAKEVGPYLVVPLKDALSGRVIVTASPTLGYSCGDVSTNMNGLVGEATGPGPAKPRQRRKSLPSSPLTLNESPIQTLCDNSRTSASVTGCPQPDKSPTDSGASVSMDGSYLKEEELEVMARGSSERLRLDRQRRNSDAGGRTLRHLRDTSCRTRTSSRTNSIVSSDSGNSSSHSATMSDTAMAPYSDDTTDSYNSSNMSYSGSLELPKHIEKCEANNTSASATRTSEVPPPHEEGGLKVNVPCAPRHPCVQRLSSLSDNPESIEHFSDYDVRTDEAPSSPASPDTPREDEYEYFLGKVRKNFALKENVHKLIMSESSDYEACSSAGATSGADDSMSFTTVTSDDGCSITGSDTRNCILSTGSGMRLKGTARTSVKTASVKQKPQTVRQTKHKSRHQSSRRAQQCTSGKSCRSSSKVPCSLHQCSDDAEFYRLPDFQSSQHVTTAAPSIPSPVLELDPNEKFSCRVTKLRPEDIKRPVVPTTSGSNSTKDITHVTVKRSTTSSKSVSSENTRPNTQNRVLSDLMRMNHDRLTAMF